MTNKEKLQELFKETFYFLPPDDFWYEVCDCDCPAPEGVCTMMCKKYEDENPCKHCAFHDFWNAEYKQL